MQVKIKIGRKWWLLPVYEKDEFTEKDMEVYSDVPYIKPLKNGESVFFFDLQGKKTALIVLNTILAAYHDGYRPVFEKGSYASAITFKKI